MQLWVIMHYFKKSNCDPRFFTTVVFYKGAASMETTLKFEVFDVCDKVDSKVGCDMRVRGVGDNGGVSTSSLCPCLCEDGPNGTGTV